MWMSSEKLNRARQGWRWRAGEAVHGLPSLDQSQIAVDLAVPGGDETVIALAHQGEITVLRCESKPARNIPLTSEVQEQEVKS